MPADRIATVTDLSVYASLRAAEDHPPTVPCGPPDPAWVHAFLSDDGDDRIMVQRGDEEPFELPEVVALTLGHHLVSLATIKRRERGLST
jgi:hypothetical protein